VEKEILEKLFLESISHMKIVCTKGSSLQNLIVNTHGMLKALKDTINGNIVITSEVLQVKCFQLLANLCVKNEWSLEKVWSSMSDLIITKFESDNHGIVNIAAMIIYNMVLSKVHQLNYHQVVEISLHHYNSFLKDSSRSLPDFVKILMDYTICQNPNILDIYILLEQDDQKTFLYYVHDHVEEDSNE
jgi:hypothetical protein